MLRLRADEGLLELSGVRWLGEPQAGEWALVLRGAGIRTGVNIGRVEVDVEHRASAPADDELADWEDVVEAPAHLEADACVCGLFELPVEGSRLSREPGLHGVLIAARGRDASYDAVDDASGERYLVATWPTERPIASRARWARSRVGAFALLEPAPAPMPPPPPSDPEALAREENLRRMAGLGGASGDGAPEPR